MNKLIISLVMIFSMEISAETLRLTHEQWLPYVSWEDKGILSKRQIQEYSPNRGSISRLVSAVFALKGIKVEYTAMSAKRAYFEAKKGRKWKGSIAWNKTPDRLRDLYFSDTLIREKRYFFHLKSFKFNWKTLNDLRGIRIGGDSVTNYGRAFREAEKIGIINVQRAIRKEQNLGKLLRSRFDIYPMSPRVAQHFLRKYYPDKMHLITHHPRVLQDTTYHLILSKRDKRNLRILKLFNQGLRQLRKNRKYNYFFKTPGNR